MPELRQPRVLAVRVTLEPDTRDLAGARKRQRAGKLSGRGTPVEIRNGLPWRPYVYRGGDRG